MLTRPNDGVRLSAQRRRMLCSGGDRSGPGGHHGLPGRWRRSARPIQAALSVRSLGVERRIGRDAPFDRQRLRLLVGVPGPPFARADRRWLLRRRCIGFVVLGRGRRGHWMRRGSRAACWTGGRRDGRRQGRRRGWRCGLLLDLRLLLDKAHGVAPRLPFLHRLVETWHPRPHGWRRWTLFLTRRRGGSIAQAAPGQISENPAHGPINSM